MVNRKRDLRRQRPDSGLSRVPLSLLDRFMNSSARPSSPSPHLSGASLVELLLHLTMLASAAAGAFAGRHHGPAGIVQGLVCGFVIGGLGILASMLLISAVVAIVGSHEGRGRLRKAIDNVAAVVLMVLLASTPLWAALATSRAIIWLYRK